MSGSTAPTPAGDVPGLAPRALARWAWRQLTSMRTALILLLLLALGSIPGSVIPQEKVDSLRVSQWQDAHPRLTPVYERLGLFNVFDSVWFSAIYLLLMISLVGCILPRTRVYLRGVRARPPASPRRLDRMPEHRAWPVEPGSADVLIRAREVLGRRRFRLEDRPGEVAAERGYLREAGNLLFHVSLLVVLGGFAFGSMLGYTGGVIVATGNGFTNTLSQYDDFRAGGLFSAEDLTPLSFTVDDFDLTFIREGRQRGMAGNFSAGLTYRAGADGTAKSTRISVNHPLTVDGAKVYLISHGYAPRITVRDSTGQPVYSGSTPFLPEDTTFRSFGVVKVPDAEPQGVGLEGEFYPTYVRIRGQKLPFSAFPDAKNPVISMLLYRGDLGMDAGGGQSVYNLDKTGMSMVRKGNGAPLRVDLAVGGTQKLPDGLGTVTFDGVDRFVKLQVSHSPGDWVALLGVLLALLGLTTSLFVRPRRIWVRVREDGGRRLIEVAGLDRSWGSDLATELDELVLELRGESPPADPSHPQHKEDQA